MGSNCCRFGDTGSGVCNSHDSPKPYTTIFNMTAITVNANSLGVATIGTVGIATCGHPTIALVGSSTVNAEGKGIHRLGDTGANGGTYIAMVGSPNVFAGG